MQRVKSCGVTGQSAQSATSFRQHALAAAVAGVSLAVVSAVVHAQDRTFDAGGNGTSWNDANNWNLDDVPNTAAENAVIDAGGAFNVTLNGSFTIGDLTVGSDDSLSFNTSQVLTLQGDTLSNAGQITLNYSAGGFTDLRIEQGQITLTGGGIIDMVANTRILGALPTDELIISNQTIRGSGGIGGNILKLTNQADGLIDANIATPGNPLLIDPGSGNMTNAGIMQASNGGTLTLFGGTGSYNNTGGTIQALNNSFVTLLSGVSISGGTLSTTGTGVIQTDNSAGVNLDGVSNAGQLTINDNSDLNVFNTITNSGNIGFFSIVGNAKEIVLQTSNVTFDGGGTITLDDVTGQANIRDAAGTRRLTLSNQIVRGSGNVGGDTIAITLGASGQINANSSGRTLTVDPTDSAPDDGGAIGLTNNGLMQATNGATLALNSGTYTNNTTIQADGASSVVQLNSLSSIVGGTLKSINGGVVQTNTSIDASLDNVTLSGQLNIRDNTDLNLSNTITNSGDIGWQQTAGNPIDIVLQTANVTLAGGGTVTLNNSIGAANIRDDSGTKRLTIDNQTVRGSGNVGFDTIVLTLNANGIIDANSSGRTLTVDPTSAAADDAFPSGLTNNGILRATNGGTLALADGTYTNNNVIRAGASSLVELRNNAVIVGGTLESVGTGVVQVPVNNSPFLDGVTFNGKLNVLDNADLNLSNTITNTGDIAFITSAGNQIEVILRTNNVTLNGGGTITLDNTGNVNGGMINDASGIRRLTLSNQIVRGSGNVGGDSIAITLGASGQINANSSGRTLTVDPTDSAPDDGGAIGLTNNGLMQATNGATLALNSGTYTNNTTIQADGTGSVVQLNSLSSIVGGTLKSINGGVVQTDTGVDASLDGVSLSGQLNIRDNTDLNLSNTITNSGDIGWQQSSGNPIEIRLQTANVALAGGGTVTLNNSIGAANILDDSGTKRLTLSNQTVRGSGNVGGDTIAITLGASGQINANSNGRTLLVDPTPSAPDDGGATGLTNNGLMQATNGATLALNSGTYTNNTTIQADGASSVVQLNDSATIVGGTLKSINGGVVQTNTSIDASLDNVTLSGQLNIRDNADLNLSNTITNSGDIGWQQTAGNPIDIVLQTANVTLAGGGTVTLNNSIGAANIRDDSGTKRLTIDNQTVRGSGNVGFDTIVLTLNANGIIDANSNGATLTVDPTTSAPDDGGASGLVSAGTMRASLGGTLQLAAGSYTNNGLFEVLNGSALSMSSGAVLTNNAAGVLTGGTYRAVSTGNAATMTLRGTAIGTIAADTTVELSGALANIQVVATSLASSLTTNNGTLKILDGHSFSVANALTNNGTIELGGSGLAGADLSFGVSFTNGASGLVFGHGTIHNTILNHGTVRAENGTLTMNGGVIDGQSGTIEIASGASLDLSSSGGDSDTDYLTHNGVNLNLGTHSVIVRKDYMNAGFGLGNSFSPRANVSGGGSINASPALSQSVTGANVTNGSSSLPILSFGNTRVGTPVVRSFQVSNTTAGETTLRGAIQTTANGANVTDARLSGTGVTASNWTVGPNASTSAYGVTFNASSAGAISGQQVHVINNFDNVQNQTLQFSGAAYNPAVLGVVPPSIAMGDVHVGDPSPAQSFTISNDAPAGAFSEDLLVNNFSASGDATYSGPTSTLILAGSSDNTSGGSLTFASAGAKSGSINFDAYTNATVNNVAISGLSAQLLSSPSVSYTATVYRLAQPSVPATLNLGDRHVGAAASGNIIVQNLAAADGFSEILSAAVNSFDGDVSSASGSTPINPGSNSGALLTASLFTGSAGAKSGNVYFDLTSLGAGTLSDTPLSGQSTAVTANVYRLAAPQILTSPPVAFGIVHVGDLITQVPLSIKNNAVADGFSEKLDASTGPHEVGIIGGGTIDNLAAQGTDNSSLLVGIGTGSATNINGNYVVNFTSDGDGINSLGQTSLGSQNVQVTAQVNNYADTEFAKVGGDGAFTENDEQTYTLDLGSVFQNDSDPSAQLKLINDIPSFQPGDVLGGTWVLNASDFILSGFDPFSNLAAGADLSGLTVTLDTSTLGNFTGTITLQSAGSNTSGYSGDLPDVVINISGNVVAVPEPATGFAAFVVAGGILAIRRRRRRRHLGLR